MSQMPKVLTGVDSSCLDYYLYYLPGYKQMANREHIDHLVEG